MYKEIICIHVFVCCLISLKMSFYICMYVCMFVVFSSILHVEDFIIY